MARYYRKCQNPTCPFKKDYQGEYTKQPFKTTSKTDTHCPHCSQELPPYDPPAPANPEPDEPEEDDVDTTVNDDSDNNDTNDNDSNSDDSNVNTDDDNDGDDNDGNNGNGNDNGDEEEEERRNIVNKHSILWPILASIAALILLGAAISNATNWFGLGLGITFIVGATALFVGSLVWLISKSSKMNKEGFKTFGQWSAIIGGILICLALVIALFMGNQVSIPAENSSKEQIEEDAEEVVEEEAEEEITEEVVEEYILGWERLETKELPSGSICIGDVEIEIEGEFIRYYDEGGTYESTIVINNSSNPINIHAEWGAGEIPVTAVDINKLIQNELEHGCDGKCTSVRLVTITVTGQIIEEFIYKDE